MRNGHGVNFAHSAVRKPGRLDAADTRIHHHTLVPAYGVERKRRHIGGHIQNVPVRHKAKLNQRLKSVADAEHKPIPLVQKPFHRVGKPGVTQKCGNKLAGTLRFVPAGESTGKHDDIGTVNRLLCGRGLSPQYPRP